MATTEHTINDAIAGLLRETRHTWRNSTIVSSENTSLLKGSNARPDIVISEPNVSPVVVETEVLPAATVETEAIARLGEQLRLTGRTILSSIAVRLPVRVRTKQGTALKEELAAARDLEIALYTGSSPSSAARWPRSGWILGSIADLSILVQSASVPPSVIDAAADQLVNGVSETAGLLEDMAQSHPGAIHKISEQLRQEDGVQTRRMAATILANAFMFHENLAGGPGDLGDVRSLAELQSHDELTKMAILGEWKKILKVNYWPIFDIARRILELIPAPDSKPLIDGLAATADKLLQNRLMRSHDLTGAVFQRLIADRKFLAAYYTTPASAALLVGLAITPDQLPNGGSWAKAEDVKQLRIADFACGTGTLLSTAYQRVSQLYEMAGGDAERLHPDMMATALVGCDVLPAAAHLTASMLASAHPTVKYEQSSILTVAYGKQEDGGIALGSLDLLDPQGRLDLISIATKALEGTGETTQDTWRSLPHATFDVVIMNPPFTRPTGHEGKKIGVPNPMFAAFSSSAEEQRLMGQAIKRLTDGTSAHGNAGEASIFLVLADRKLKVGGALALITPLSLMSGDAWDDSRILLRKNYDNLILISIAGAEDSEMSFSADTDMGECIVIGQKSINSSNRATFVILNERPPYPLLGASAAEQIRRLIRDKNVHHLEDGPVGGTSLYFGDEQIGQIVDAPLPKSGGWNLARIADISLAQTAYQIVAEKCAWLPTMSKYEAPKLPITTVSAIAKVGPYHADIDGKTSTGGLRGPFDVVTLKPNSIPTYPVLWSHEAERERTIRFDADCEGTIRQGKTPNEQEIIVSKVQNIWNSASYAHFNRDFRFNSQSTAMQFTPRKTIGGRAWLSIQLASIEQEKALVTWGNTSFGLLLHWWHANKQQSGRGSIGVMSLATMPVLDVTALTAEQLKAAAQLFDEMCDQPLRPFHEIDQDPVRKALDEAFSRRVLGLPESIFEPLELVRLKLSREPSIRGSK
ncbi:MAG: hypothetical protein BroJett018_50920 [Chloroflexota bacterium]|nr:hypothetical protein [Chloroflexota bacterium]NOG66428.1 hypothetical protein [Chloroflexota bacterium]GIK67298.1 MAG: hypothetical protein BroJett018_50920 [Chloroflexota bacterium]